jgi:hypothetical protein
VGETRTLCLDYCPPRYWALRLSLIVGIGIVTMVLVRRENGVICLPRFNVATAALGMAIDLFLDMFLIYQTIKFFSKSDEDIRHTETIVLASSISLLAWHFVWSLRCSLMIVFHSVSVQSRWSWYPNHPLLHLSQHCNM